MLRRINLNVDLATCEMCLTHIFPALLQYSNHLIICVVFYTVHNLLYFCLFFFCLLVPTKRQAENPYRIRRNKTIVIEVCPIPKVITFDFSY